MKILILSLLLLASCATTQKSSVLSRQVCQDLNLGKEFVYAKHYSESFQKALAKDQLASIFDEVKNQYGDCEEVIDFKRTAQADKFSTKHSSGKIIDFTIVEKNSEITGLWILGERPKEVVYQSIEQARKDFELLPGASLLILEDAKINTKVNINKRTPLGSTFKLFVLDALVQQIKMKELTWDKEFEIKDSLKSFPSGVMQTKENGEKFSLSEYAQKMISISDNTATDHLIEIIGRTKVEKQIKKRNLKKSYGWNRPFLSTMEFFRAKAEFDSADYKKYAGNTTTGRLLQLQKLSKVSKKDIENKLSKWQEPRGVYDVEWFSTPKEICSLLKSLSNENDPELVKVLSLNTPFVDKEKFDQVFYKGGSEPGVIQMAYLFKNNNKSTCLYAGSADSASAVDESVFFEKVKAVIQLIEKSSGKTI